MLVPWNWLPRRSQGANIGVRVSRTRSFFDRESLDGNRVDIDVVAMEKSP